MSAAATATLAGELRVICGAEYVLEPRESVQPEPANPDAHLFDNPVVVSPGTADEIVAILRLANEHGFSVVPRGRHANRGWIAARGDVVVDTTRLNEVEHYDPADLTVGVGAGMTVAQLSTLVSADGLLFPVDPPLPERATIGEVLATASHGPLRHGYGGLRDFCIGIRFVTGDGRKAKGGGRVVKNVAGYDMMKLLIGSQGTLAVITSASFKLFPAPRQTRTFLAEFGNWREALKFRDIISRSPLSPMCLELLSPNVSKWIPLDGVSESWGIWVRASGSDAVLARYRQELGTTVTQEMEGERESALWRGIANSSQLVRTDVFVSPNRVAEVLESLEELSQQHLPEVAVLGRVGIGHVQVATRFPVWGGIDPQCRVIDHLHKHVQGEISYSTGSNLEPWRIAPSALVTMRAVKQALDPRDILNRGRFPS